MMMMTLMTRREIMEIILGMIEHVITILCIMVIFFEPVFLKYDFNIKVKSSKGHEICVIKL